MKIQSTEWEKIFANMTDKGLISKVYKQLILETNKNKKTNLIKKKKKQAEDLNRHFSKKIYRRPSGTRKDAQHH